LTFFAALIRRLGLTQADAATYLRAGNGTVDAWCRGRRNPHPDVWVRLRALADRQAEISDPIADVLERAPGGLGAIEANLPAGDWPGKGAAAVALVDAWLLSGHSAPVVIVEPGSTPATAAARGQRLKIN
jgi:hypothetical protein